MPGPKPKLKVGLHKPLKILVSETNVMKKGSEKDVTWIDFTWGPIQDDNCLMQGALFRIVSDGGAGFYAEVQTTDSGDVWLVQGLGLLDKNGVEMYRVPQFDGPTMDNENYAYYINIGLAYPAYLYPYVRHIRMYHHC